MTGLGRLLFQGVGRGLLALGLGALASATAAAQSISVDKPVYGNDETVRITYSTPAPCRCELQIINLSDILRQSSFDAWIRDAFYKPGGVNSVPVYYTYWQERVRLDAGKSGTFEYNTNLLYAKSDKSRSWYRALLIKNTTEILAQVPFMVVKQRGPAPGVLALENEVGTPATSFVGTQRLVARLSGAATSPDAIKSELWPLGAATASKGGTLPANASAQTLQLDGFAAGRYELRFVNQLGIVLGSSTFELTYPYSETALSFVPARAGDSTAIALPKLAISSIGRTYLLSLFRIAGERLERVWGWEVGNTPHLDLAQRWPADLRTLPPGTYEFRLHMGNNEIDGRYLISRKRLVIDTNAPASGSPATPPPPATAAPGPPPRLMGQISLARGGPVLVGDNFDVSFDLPAGDGPTWLALYPKPYYVATCTILDAMPPLSVKEGTIGNARFRYPVLVSGSGTATLLAPWRAGEYEVRIYRGEVPSDVAKLAYPKATLVAAMPLTVGLAEPLFTIRPSIGAVVELGSAIELDVMPSDKLRRDLFKSWYVDVGIWRSSEILPGGGVAARGITGQKQIATMQDGKLHVRIPSIDLDPGPYEIEISARVPEGPTFRFVVRHNFDVPPPSQPPLPASAPYRRAKLLPAPEGYTPPFGGPDDCAKGSLASLLGQPPIVISSSQPPAAKPTLVVAEWVAGDPDTDADDRYVPVTQMFPGFPYVVEARFPTAQSAESFTVSHPGNGTILVKRTADPLVYRSALVVLVPEAGR